MLQARRRLGLARESDADFLSEGEVRWQDLDRYAALQLEVASALDDPHSATTNFPLDFVRIGEDIGEPGGQRFLVALIHVASAPNPGYINAPRKVGQPE